MSLSKKPSAKPFDLSKISKKLEGMQKGLEKPIEMITKLWGKFSKFVGGLNKKYLAPLMAPLTGLLNSFADMNPDKKKKGKPNPKKEVSKKAAAITAVKPDKDETSDELEKLMGEIKPEQKPLDHTKIRSAPFERSKRTGVTLCSKTAKLNLQKLAPEKKFIAIDYRKVADSIQHIRNKAKTGQYRIEDVIPTGNADDIEQFYLDTQRTIISGNVQEKIGQLNSSGKTVCDIITFGSTKFGHRAAGFKGIDGNWYVLDPYRYQGKTEPILFKEYVEKYDNDIKFVVPIDTSKKHRVKVAAK